ncbi:MULTISPECIES: 4-hydroxyphenylacetate catabolism regulatory protein HpaA [unclassified Vibrio]|uniref:4-hydroxyphenylacetate catabolism regulatory protein HpaA n=1 Tax=Vibrio sp. 99-8-1 TaxID=2607602 RepID=UPI001493AE91|nr:MULTISPECIES: 4-hydroxyphenylacetate catabolism regulatory protein HpaA [unclassified Vibrio]NOI66775.1 4-hydroxyphenylacetate catabolism regulatory protein HpaA [Vibrio sp. 99-8-1]
MRVVTKIPNINIGQVYDQRYANSELHFEYLDNLANFFGRNMPVHYHDRFYQIHIILDGSTHVHLDEKHYTNEGITLFFTPPAVPHSFVTESSSSGYVLTIQQQLVWRLLDMECGLNNIMVDQMKPFCTQLVQDCPILSLIQHLKRELDSSGMMQEKATQSLLQLVLIEVMRLGIRNKSEKTNRSVDITLFHNFNHLVETHYIEHWALGEYAEKIGISVSRLNDICRRVSGLSSKKIIIDRQMQEARRSLQFTSKSVSEIGYDLGFRDPAYFARFFRKYSDMTASEYRSKVTKNVENNY